MGYMCVFQFWFPQGVCLGVGLLGHMVVLFLVFKGISIPSSIVAVSVYIPINRDKERIRFFHRSEETKGDDSYMQCGTLY